MHVPYGTYWPDASGARTVESRTSILQELLTRAGLYALSLPSHALNLRLAEHTYRYPFTSRLQSRPACTPSPSFPCPLLPYLYVLALHFPLVLYFLLSRLSFPRTPLLYDIPGPLTLQYSLTSLLFLYNPALMLSF